ncbi:MAG: hypothetical protein U0U67_16735 [Chitinophagales bacterium]
MKKYQFALLICLPLCWFFYKLLPMYVNPAACSTANFIYAENFEQFKIWCFDSFSKLRFDDSSNFLYSLSLWLFIHFFKFNIVKAAIYVNGISMLFSVLLVHRIVASRFVSVQLLLVGLLFLSTQIWAGVLGDEIIFQGMLWLLAVRSFWHQRYFWLVIWTVVNVIARPDNIFILLPLIATSFCDVFELKERDKRKFWLRRIRRTFSFLIFPLAGYFAYRYLYFGKILPYNWLHHSLETDKKYGIFNSQGFYYSMHYLRYYVLPLAIGVVFYFLKERKELSVRYYALAFSFIIVPFVYNCTFSQDENLAFKNQYAIYVGLILLSLLFIRDYRSLSQGISTAIFIFFFGFKISFGYFQKTLQMDKDNLFYLANDLSEIHNGKAIVFYDNFVSWITDWNTVFASGKHSKDGKALTATEIENTNADLIFGYENYDEKLKAKYDLYLLPTNTRSFEKEIEPENSLDKFFYKYSHAYPVNKHAVFPILVLKSGKNNQQINSILENHGGKRKSE